jgi:hypothetical protein
MMDARAVNKADAEKNLQGDAATRLALAEATAALLFAADSDGIGRVRL